MTTKKAKKAETQSILDYLDHENDSHKIRQISEASAGQGRS